MLMKKLTQVFVLLSLFHILLCLLSFQIHVAEARLRHLGQSLFLVGIFVCYNIIKSESIKIMRSVTFIFGL